MNINIVAGRTSKNRERAPFSFGEHPLRNPRRRAAGATALATFVTVATLASGCGDAPTSESSAVQPDTVEESSVLIANGHGQHARHVPFAIQAPVEGAVAVATDGTRVRSSTTPSAARVRRRCPGAAPGA